MGIVIATRGSELALRQAGFVKNLLEKEYGTDICINVYKTTGDRITDRPLSEIGGKGVFVKELEKALLSGEADMAVHSMKDVPIELPEGLEIYLYPDCASANDALVSVKYKSLNSLPKGAVIGTSSLRRRVQIKNLIPDAEIRDLRGNVDSRLSRVLSGEFDAVILAEAGLRRLNLENNIVQSIPTNKMIPAPCQGIIGVEIRTDDIKIKKMLEFMRNIQTDIRVSAERSFLSKLQAGCHAPVGCFADIFKSSLQITGFIADMRSNVILKESVSGNVSNAKLLGRQLAENLLEKGGEEILKSYL